MIEAPTNELGGLFLGDIISIMKEDIMKNNKIQAVLSCMYESNNNIKQTSQCNILFTVIKFSPSRTHLITLSSTTLMMRLLGYISRENKSIMYWFIATQVSLDQPL